MDLFYDSVDMAIYIVLHMLWHFITEGLLLSVGKWSLFGYVQALEVLG